MTYGHVLEMAKNPTAFDTEYRDLMDRTVALATQMEVLIDDVVETLPRPTEGEGREWLR